MKKKIYIEIRKTSSRARTKRVCVWSAWKASTTKLWNGKKAILRWFVCGRRLLWSLSITPCVYKQLQRRWWRHQQHWQQRTILLYHSTRARLLATPLITVFDFILTANSTLHAIIQCTRLNQFKRECSFFFFCLLAYLSVIAIFAVCSTSKWTQESWKGFNWWWTVSNGYKNFLVSFYLIW